MKRSCVGLKHSRTLQIYFSFKIERNDNEDRVYLFEKAKKKALDS